MFESENLQLFMNVYLYHKMLEQLGQTADIEQASYCGWYKHESDVETGRSLFTMANRESANEFLIYYHQDVRGLSIFPGGSEVNSGYNLSDYRDVWMHMCVTYDSSDGNVTLYINGDSVYEDSVDPGLTLRFDDYSQFCNTQELDDAGTGTEPDLVGSAEQAYEGYQAQTYFYDRLLDSDEVLDVYNGHVQTDYMFSLKDFSPFMDKENELVRLNTTDFPLDRVSKPRNLDILVNDELIQVNNSFRIGEPIKIDYSFTAASDTLSISFTPAGHFTVFSFIVFVSLVSFDHCFLFIFNSEVVLRSACTQQYFFAIYIFT